jgi:hypothetical protein
MTGIWIIPGNCLTVRGTFQSLVSALCIGIIHTATNFLSNHQTDERTGNSTYCSFITACGLITDNTTNDTAHNSPDSLAIAIPGIDSDFLAGQYKLDLRRFIPDLGRLLLVVMIIVLATISMRRRPRWRPILGVFISMFVSMFVFMMFFPVTAVTGFILPGIGTCSQTKYQTTGA